MFYRLKYNSEFEAHQNEKEEGRCVRAIDPTKSQPKDDGDERLFAFSVKIKNFLLFRQLVSNQTVWKKSLKKEKLF